MFFSIVYFFAATSFFQGWKKAKFFDDVPDLIFFTVAFGVFGSSFKLKDLKTRRLLAWGAGLLCVARLVEVPMQEYQAIVGTLGFGYWLFPFFLTFFGFVFSLFALRKVIK